MQVLFGTQNYHNITPLKSSFLKIEGSKEPILTKPLTGNGRGKL